MEPKNDRSPCLCAQQFRVFFSHYQPEFPHGFYYFIVIRFFSNTKWFVIYKPCNFLSMIFHFH